jgi:hypothetical protein
VFRDAPSDPDQPVSALRPGILRAASLTMFGAAYDGVIELPAHGGALRSLRFSMSKAVNTPFDLRISEPDGTTTDVASSELTIAGRVRFTTPKFTGNLFGVIPVAFTPDSPPPPMPPILWFTDVTIDLAFVRCDTLRADALDITSI